MFCKFCGKVIEDDLPVCPECGKDLSQPVGNSQNSLDPTPESAPKKKVWPLVAGISGTVVLLAVLAIFLLEQFGVKANPIPYIWGGSKETTAATETTGTEETGEPTEPAATINPNFVASNYCVEEKLAVSEGTKIAATVGDAQLTNATLQIYYRMQIMEFLNYYGSYLSYVGLDYTQPLGGQPCYYDDTISWEQFFVDCAIEAWQQDQVLCLMAEKNGYTLPQEMEEEIQKLPASLEEQAAEGDYESAEAMIKDVLGAANDMDSYMAYIRTKTLAEEYYLHVYENAQPTDDEAKAYFEENKDTFAESGVTEEGLESSVRHILICPEISEGASEATEEQWAACLAEAEKILQEWKDGEATEESFAALVPTYTEDTGSAETGGLYENINPTANYVEDFLSWSVDGSRQPGDTGIVKSQYGYHIMYYVSGEPYWLVSARAQIVSDATRKMIEEGLTEFPLVRFDEDIVLQTVELA